MRRKNPSEPEKIIKQTRTYVKESVHDLLQALPKEDIEPLLREILNRYSKNSEIDRLLSQDPTPIPDDSLELLIFEDIDPEKDDIVQWTDFFKEDGSILGR